MHGSGSVIGQNRNTLLVDYVTCVYFMLKEESGYTCLLVTIDYGPVYGGSSSVLRQ